MGWISDAKDSIVKKLALSWLKGKAGDKEGTVAKVLKALAGWKLLIGVGVLFALKVWDTQSGGHTSGIAMSVLTVLGWLPPDGWTGESMTVAAAGTLAVIGFLARLWRAQRQLQAGAKVTELLTTEGYVKASMANGTLLPIVAKAASDATDKVVDAQIAQAVVVEAAQDVISQAEKR